MEDRQLAAVERVVDSSYLPLYEMKYESNSINRLLKPYQHSRDICMHISVQLSRAQMCPARRQLVGGGEGGSEEHDIIEPTLAP